jgi:hypothetical protein
MILKTPNCPVCGLPAKVILESVIVVAPVVHYADGTYGYGDGLPDVQWGTAEPIVGVLGLMLECRMGHEWPSHTEETQA